MQVLLNPQQPQLDSRQSALQWFVRIHHHSQSATPNKLVYANNVVNSFARFFPT